MRRQRFRDFIARTGGPLLVPVGSILLGLASTAWFAVTFASPEFRAAFAWLVDLSVAVAVVGLALVVVGIVGFFVSRQERPGPGPVPSIDKKTLEEERERALKALERNNPRDRDD
jgi:hypothetical protein